MENQTIQHKVKPLPFQTLVGISDKTNQIHHGKLYTGYVNKRNEIETALAAADKSKANTTYSVFGELKRQETFAANGQILHEIFFGCLGGKGEVPESVKGAISKNFGSFEKWKEEFVACGMSARGWVVMAFDPSDGRIHNYTGDTHNQGGVWGAIPLLTLDVFEHAYFIDYGSDRASYIADYFKNLNWQVVEDNFRKAGLLA